MITIHDILRLNPCYDPIRYLPKDWQGTLVDILNIEDCPPEDRIWVVTRLLDDKTSRLFAVWCARQALKLVKDPDPQSIKACDVADKFAEGKATQDELRVAYRAAWIAALDAVAAAKSTAAWAATAAAHAASDAKAVAWNAADAATWAAKAAAGDVAGADADARAASNAAWDAQITKLKEMVEVTGIMIK